MDSNYKYTIYKTTNKANGKVYIGCHKTTNPADDYIGSGTILKRAIRKHGRDSFEKSVLFIFDSPEQMFAKEAEIVDRLFVESDNTYNLLEGGWGGFDYVNANGKNLYGQNGDETHGRKNLISGKLFVDYKQYLIGKGLWEEWRKRVSDGLRQRYETHPSHWIGRKHREESKRKIGVAASINQLGKGNSQYGTCWVYSSGQKKNLRIKKDELPAYLKHGWQQGRKMNFNTDK